MSLISGPTVVEEGDDEQEDTIKSTRHVPHITKNENFEEAISYQEEMKKSEVRKKKTQNSKPGNTNVTDKDNPSYEHNFPRLGRFNVQTQENIKKVYEDHKKSMTSKN
jgi:hypothetical protein